MLSQRENSLLAKVSPGTPMGELMRRYWQPIAAIAELDENPIKRVRLMGEDLVLYKDKGGTYGLLALHCPHRRADLSYGWIEEHGLRCHYHGWLLDENGRCIAQPFEEVARPEARFKEKVRTPAYPVSEKAGLLWAYLGPEPVPELWDWDRFHDRGYKQIVFSHVPCNWFQCQENSIDPVHFEWLHANWSLQLRGEDGEFSPRHLKVGFDEFEYGFIYRRIRSDTDEENELWTTGRVCLWPNALYTGHFEWRVPIDDENTLSVGWFIDPVPGDAPFVQERIPYWWAPVRDPQTGRWITSHIMNQDFTAWVGQGMLSDRWNEHLGESDRGVIAIRKRLLEDLKTVADGGEPKGILRDPERNHKAYLPRVGREGGAPVRGEQGAPRFPFLAGQPQHIIDDMTRVWAEYAAAST